MGSSNQEALDNWRTGRLLAQLREGHVSEVHDDSDAEPCEDCDDEQPTTAAVGDEVVIHGLAVPYDVPTGDGRMIRRDALAWDLELEGIPIIWDREDGDHTGMTLGRVDALRGEPGGVFVEQARLFATDDEEAAAAVARVEELVAENALGWSVMLDDEVIESTMREPVMQENPDGSITVRHARSDDLMTVVSARIRHLAIVDTPAFPGARPVLGPEPVNAAATAVLALPSAHFTKWEQRELQPVIVSPDGKVWGHAAGDGCYRNGPAKAAGACKKYTPDPDPKMKNFHTGTVTLDNGEVIRVGSLTAASLHATPAGPVEMQRRHHEDTSTVWAKVIAWNDRWGRLCISGSVVPGLDPGFVAQVAGQPISVELWPVPGTPGLTLVGAHTVNTPAWPV